MTNTSIDESTIKEAATLFGTPLLCYEHSELEKYSLSLRDALPTQSTLVYSVKAGPNSYIIKYLCEQNILFETASEGELAYLLSLGISPLKIIVSGQGKTQEYFQLAITPIDQTHPKVRLHRVCIGDLLYISDCGAYSVSFSPNNFCGLRRVSEIVHRNNKFIITNRQESCEEVYGRTLIENDFNSR